MNKTIGGSREFCLDGFTYDMGWMGKYDNGEVAGARVSCVYYGLDGWVGWVG